MRTPRPTLVLAGLVVALASQLACVLDWEIVVLAPDRTDRSPSGVDRAP